MNYLDAHNHLHDARLDQVRPDCLAELEALPLAGAVVNGTRQDDWSAVAKLAAEHPWITPSFGIHPWHVATRTEPWLQELRDWLERIPLAGVGEVGLDRWIKGHDLDDQTEVFVPQLRLAAELNRPLTIHCLRAWGALWELLRTEPLPARGFLIHAYGGPAEMVEGFAERGAYFSFNPYFLHASKVTKRDTFRVIPIERLLVETDAPDMRPPDEQNLRLVRDAAGHRINHPANIDLAYRALAELREIDVEALAAVVERNYRRLFGVGCAS